MELLAHLLHADPAAPRLTVYDESTGARMDFSAQTLDNWAAKVANLLEEELDLDSSSTILIDLPVSWQAAVIALGAVTAGVRFEMAASASADATFTTVDRAEAHSGNGGNGGNGGDVLAVSLDPFGRGVVETGGTLPAGVLDFGPTVRFYGDHYAGTTRPLPELYAPTEGAPRLLSTGWTDSDSFAAHVLSPLAGGGSAVIVAGLASAERLDAIAANEKVTARV